MISRIRVQNYRSIEDLTLELKPKNLLMGLNGSGKTTILDALAAIRELVVEGEQVVNEKQHEQSLFPFSSVPRWLRSEQVQRLQQRFELDFEGPDGPLRYVLVIEHNEAISKSRVSDEQLWHGERLIFNFRQGTVQLYHRNYDPGPAYDFDWNGSALRTVLRPEHAQIGWFRDRLRDLACLRIDAPGMAARSEKEQAQPARDLTNFASWYRRALVANAAAGVDYLQDIRQVIGGLASLDLHDLGQGIMVLRAAFELADERLSTGKKPRSTFWLGFDELSDGQRALIGLYALLHFVLRAGATLCIDEPDNFVALAELQPWLLRAADRVDDYGAQIVIASHHPEILNLFAVDYGIQLEREGSGPTTGRPYHYEGLPVSPAEVVARGWEA